MLKPLQYAVIMLIVLFGLWIFGTSSSFKTCKAEQTNAEKNLKNSRELREASTDAAIAGNLTNAWTESHSKIESASLRLGNALAQRRRDWQGTGSYKEPDAPIATKPIDLPSGWILASPEQLSTHI